MDMICKYDEVSYGKGLRYSRTGREGIACASTLGAAMGACLGIATAVAWKKCRLFASAPPPGESSLRRRSEHERNPEGCNGRKTLIIHRLMCSGQRRCDFMAHCNTIRRGASVPVLSQRTAHHRSHVRASVGLDGRAGSVFALGFASCWSRSGRSASLLQFLLSSLTETPAGLCSRSLISVHVRQSM